MIENENVETESAETQAAIEAVVKSYETDRAALDSAEPRNNGKYNRSAIKRHALKVSIETRNGKFSRISSEFIDNVETQIEAKLLTLRREVLSFTGQSVETDGAQFLTGDGRRKLEEAFNLWIGGEIHRITKDIKVGKTF